MQSSLLLTTDPEAAASVCIIQSAGSAGSYNRERLFPSLDLSSAKAELFIDLLVHPALA